MSKLSHVPNNGPRARIRGTEVRPATQAGQGPGRDACVGNDAGEGVGGGCVLVDLGPLAMEKRSLLPIELSEPVVIVAPVDKNSNKIQPNTN